MKSLRLLLLTGPSPKRASETCEGPAKGPFRILLALPLVTARGRFLATAFDGESALGGYENMPNMCWHPGCKKPATVRLEEPNRNPFLRCDEHREEGIAKAHNPSAVNVFPLPKS
jgi:hypothetical protein